MKETNSESHRNPEQSLHSLSQESGRTIGSFTSSIKDSTNKYRRKGQTYLNENPTKSLAISAMAGALVGSIVTLVSKRHK
jgi:ElaB/YqjD/DUF883 family membrane-anchored ribosome-binding protein